jgi:hypothetical protein
MAIQSRAFGGVTLSGGDAKKFTAQVRYGKPRAAAVEGVREGIQLARSMNSEGKVSVKLVRKGK